MALVPVPTALGAEALRNAGRKCWSIGWKSYMKALHPLRPTGFKVLREQASILRDSLSAGSPANGRHVPPLLPPFPAFCGGTCVPGRPPSWS